MRLARIRLRGYRCFDDVDLSLNRRTLLIGGNGVGKTSVLEAIDRVFGAGRRNYGFQEQDLAADATELIADFELSPDDSAVFTPQEHALFETHIDIGGGDREVVRVRVVASTEEDGVFRSRGVFVKSDDESDGPFDGVTRGFLNFFYLPSARDARHEFEDARGLWARLAGLMVTAHDPDQLAELTTAAGRDLVSAILGDDRLDELSGTVQRFIGAMYGDSDLDAELRATAIDFRTLLRRTVLVLGRQGALLPLEQQSTGLQSLALFGLFRAYLGTAPGYLLAAGLEEPEIHLAPHVARSLVSLATRQDDQVILTTHSSSVTDAIPIEDIRLLRNTGSGTVAHELLPEFFEEEELARLRRELRTVGTEFLFARSVLLCEGASERGALPEFAHKMQVDLDSLGVSIVQVGGGGFAPYLKLLGPRGFNIPHAVACDNDRVVKSLMRDLQALDLLPQGIDPKACVTSETIEALRKSGYFAWSVGDFESYLVEEGGYEYFEGAADLLYGVGDLAAFRLHKLQEGIDDEAEIVRQYTRRRYVRKPELAAECASRFATVPVEVARLLDFLVTLTGIGTGGNS